MMKEIVGHPGYFVTDQGEVFSNKSGSLKRLKPQRDWNGYLHVGLSTNGHAQTIKIQILVAVHFIGPRPKGLVLCHNDGNRTNNVVSNLRYDTQRNNIADIKIHGTENPPRGSTNGMSKLTEGQVVEMRRLRRDERITHKVIGQMFGVSREQARDIVNRKYWRHV